MRFFADTNRLQRYDISLYFTFLSKAKTTNSLWRTDRLGAEFSRKNFGTKSNQRIAKDLEDDVPLFDELMYQ